MKSLYRLMLLLIIGFFTTTLVFFISPVNYKDTIKTEETEKNKEPEITNIELYYKDEGKSLNVNPNKIVIEHISDEETILESLPTQIFDATLMKDGVIIAEHIQNLEAGSIRISGSKTVLSREHHLTTTLDVSKENMFTTDGTYTLILKSNLIDDNTKNNLKINLTYRSPYTYVKGTNDFPNGTMPVKLYYADKNYEEVIPITKFIILNTSLNKQIISELQNALPSTSFAKTIGEINSCIYFESKALTYIEVPNTDTFYTDEKTGKLAYEALTKSMFAMDEYLTINEVTLSTDAVGSNDLFGGINISEPISKPILPHIYLGYIIDERAYLIDSVIDESDFSEDFDTLINNIFAYYTEKTPINLVSPLNKNIKLLNYTLTENNLNLNFNNAFLEITEKDSLKYFILDSLTKTFTELNNIDSISITIEGIELQDYIEGEDFSGSVKAPEYINVSVNDTEE